MEDLSVFLKRTYLEQMYKKKTDTFGTVQERVEKMNEQRKISRHDILFEKRKIPENLTPIASPVVKLEKMAKLESKKKNVVVEEPVKKRLEMLAKWKAEKEKKKLEQKKKQKPLFKVTHVPVAVGLPNLETVNKHIKGKPFTSAFASPNHKFKPPPNINPINFKEEKNESTRMVTRSQAAVSLKLKTEEIEEKKAAVSTMKASKTASRINRSKENENKNTRTRQTATKSENKENEPKSSNKNMKNVTALNTEDIKEKKVRRTRKPSKFESIENNSNEKKETNDITDPSEVKKTPKKSSKNDKDEETKEKEETLFATPDKTEPPIYISPFVTLSRGKISARKEYEARRLNKSFSEHTSPKAGAAYFTWRLNNEINRLQELCNQWNKYKEEENPPEEAVSMIDVAIGQTNLLITKKFVQFRGLIERCEHNDGDTPVTCEDLHGFWDMMYIQIENLDKRFENLNKMKTNNWEEILPETNKKEPIKKKGRKLKTVKASAGLMEAIRAARRKKQEEEVAADTEIEIEKNTPRNRRSSRVQSIKTGEKSQRKSSPGLMMMKVAQYAKGVETPGKSILKSDNQRSAKTHSKSVLFQDERSLDNVESTGSISNSKSKTSLRRSSRLSKTKLF